MCWCSEVTELENQPSDATGSYADYGNPSLVPDSEIVLVERHQPRRFDLPYHHHASLELNYLVGCQMEYDLADTVVRIPENQLSIFWGAIPHRVKSVAGDGQTINVYVAFSELFGWGLPERFVANLVAGEVMCSAEPDPVDRLVFPRWADEFERRDPAFQRLLVGEVEMRIRRFAASEWSRLNDRAGRHGQPREIATKMSTVEAMIRFISDNFALPLTVAQVARHVRLSESHAVSQFRKVMGISIKEQLTRTRLNHARMLLAHSDKKILTVAMDSGFGSQSAFYEAFQARTQKTPSAYRRETRA